MTADKDICAIAMLVTVCIKSVFMKLRTVNKQIPPILIFKWFVNHGTNSMLMELIIMEIEFLIIT